jgi:hypothetical protein
MARIQKHHIIYEPIPWVVEIWMLMHRCLARIQRTKATPEQYAIMINFQHAITFEVNRMRMELDTGRDLRITIPKKEER